MITLQGTCSTPYNGPTDATAACTATRKGQPASSAVTATCGCCCCCNCMHGACSCALPLQLLSEGFIGHSTKPSCAPGCASSVHLAAPLGC
eukprot:6258740-Amphidinium_carterae.1